eukprot:scaffold22962_cov64-Phaeocystis_antarctica.AAC.4
MACEVCGDKFPVSFHPRMRSRRILYGSDTGHSTHSPVTRLRRDGAALKNGHSPTHPPVLRQRPRLTAHSTTTVDKAGATQLLTRWPALLPLLSAAELSVRCSYPSGYEGGCDPQALVLGQYRSRREQPVLVWTVGSLLTRTERHAQHAAVGVLGAAEVARVEAQPLQHAPTRADRLLRIDVLLLYGAAAVLPVDGLHRARGQVEAHHGGLALAERGEGVVAVGATAGEAARALAQLQHAVLERSVDLEEDLADCEARRSGHATRTSCRVAVGGAVRRTASSLAWLEASLTRKLLTCARPSEVWSGSAAVELIESTSAPPRLRHPCRCTLLSSGDRSKAVCSSESE